MPNPEYSENKDRKYLAKGKHGIAPSALFPKGNKSPKVVIKAHPALKGGMPVIKNGK